MVKNACKKKEEKALPFSYFKTARIERPRRTVFSLL
jgi:hypothetical protein